MELTFTPFAMIAGIVSMVAMYVTWYGVSRKKYWIAGTPLFTAFVFIVFQPVRLTTDTVQHNAVIDNHIMLGHQVALKKLPPKIEGKKYNYDDYLAAEKQKLNQTQSRENANEN